MSKKPESMSSKFQPAMVTLKQYKVNGKPVTDTAVLVALAGRYLNARVAADGLAAFVAHQSAVKAGAAESAVAALDELVQKHDEIDWDTWLALIGQYIDTASPVPLRDWLETAVVDGVSAKTKNVPAASKGPKSPKADDEDEEEEEEAENDDETDEDEDEDEDAEITEETEEEEDEEEEVKPAKGKKSKTKPATVEEEDIDEDAPAPAKVKTTKATKGKADAAVSQEKPLPDWTGKRVSYRHHDRWVVCVVKSGVGDPIKLVSEDDKTKYTAERRLCRALKAATGAPDGAAKPAVTIAIPAKQGKRLTNMLTTYKATNAEGHAVEESIAHFKTEIGKHVVHLDVANGSDTRLGVYVDIYVTCADLNTFTHKPVRGKLAGTYEITVGGSPYMLTVVVA